MLLTCSICNKNYKSRSNNVYEKTKRICSKCYQKEKAKKIFESRQFVRICPICGNEIVYTSKFNYKAANKNNSKCLSCTGCLNINNYRINNNGYKGENNPFFGKHHNEKTIDHLKFDIDRSYTKTEEHIKTLRENNAKFLSIPENRKKLNIYKDKTEAESQIIKNKVSRATKGENNPMFGKPSPIGSGNGWSGWYKHIYFRSILELSYLKYLIDNNINFENGEQKKFKIEYFDSFENRKRNYFPDYFLIDTQEIIEIKPKALINSKNNKDKFKQAKEIYKEKFKIITEENIIRLNKEDVKILYENKDLIWLKRYEDKYLKGEYK